jgi:putative membrane protein
MVHLIVSWFVSALALWLVAQIIPGIRIAGFGTALVATVVIALVNDSIGIILKILTFPLTLVTLGLFLFILNAILLWIASAIMPGFSIRGFIPALLGSVVLTLLTTVLREMVF